MEAYLCLIISITSSQTIISVNFHITFIVFFSILFCSAPLSGIVSLVTQISSCDCDCDISIWIKV